MQPEYSWLVSRTNKPGSQPAANYEWKGLLERTITARGDLPRVTGARLNRGKRRVATQTNWASVELEMDSAGLVEIRYSTWVLRIEERSM